MLLNEHKRLLKKAEISLGHTRFREIGHIRLKHDQILHKYTLQFYFMKHAKKFIDVLKDYAVRHTHTVTGTSLGPLTFTVVPTPVIPCSFHLTGN